MNGLFLQLSTVSIGKIISLCAEKYLLLSTPPQQFLTDPIETKSPLCLMPLHIMSLNSPKTAAVISPSLYDRQRKSEERKERLELSAGCSTQTQPHLCHGTNLLSSSRLPRSRNWHVARGTDGARWHAESVPAVWCGDTGAAARLRC